MNTNEKKVSNISETHIMQLWNKNYPKSFSSKITWYYLRGKERLDDCKIMIAYDLECSLKPNVDS